MSESGVPPHPVSPTAWFERDELDYQEFSAKGTRTFAIVEGRGDAFPIVFLHGLPGASFVWRPLLKSLTRKQRAIVYDLPGWGRSRSKIADESRALSLSDYVAWLGNALDSQQIEQCDLVGHDFGAALGAELLAAQPQRVRRAVWVQPVFLKASVGEGIGARIASLFSNGRWSNQEWRSLLAGEQRDFPAELEMWLPYFEELLAAPTLSMGKRAVQRLEREALAFAPSHREKVALNVRNQTVIWGELAGKPVASTVDSQITFLPTGPYPMLERPGDILEILCDFLFE